MLKFLLKGLLRDKHRSLFPVLMITAGTFLTVFLYSWLTGVIGDMIRANAQYGTGHVKVMTTAYKKLSSQLPNDLAIIGIDELIDKLENIDKNMIWTPRIKFGGLLDMPDENGETRSQGPVIGLGVDILSADTKEIEILNLKKALKKGTLPKNENEILISEEFAKKLNAKLGEITTLISSTMYGSMVIYNFKIAGIVNFGMSALDRSAIIADITGIQKALDMQNSASEIFGYTNDMVYKDKNMIKLTQVFNQQFSDKNNEFSPIMVTLGEQDGLGEYLFFANKAGSIMAIVFMFAMSLVLWNSGLMNGIRRYGEIGLRLAIGEPKGTLYRLMICESIVIGILGSFLGTLFGLAISYYLQYVGIDFGSMMQKSSILISSTLYTRVTGKCYYIGFIPGLIAPILGTMAAGIGIYKRKTAQLFKELEV